LDTKEQKIRVFGIHSPFASNGRLNLSSLKIVEDLSIVLTVKYLFLLLFLFCGSVAVAQNTPGVTIIPEDSTVQANLREADSIQLKFTHYTDSLKASFQKRIHPLDSTQNRLSQIKDSLRALHLPTARIQHQIDSLNQFRTKTLGELNTKLVTAQKRSLGQLEGLQLPPEVKGVLNNQASAIKEFQLPGELKLPGLPMNNSLASLGNFNIPRTTITSAGNLNQVVSTPRLQSQLGQSLGVPVSSLQDITKYTNEISQVRNMNAATAEKTAEQQLAKIDAAKELQVQEQKVKSMEGKISQIKDSAAVRKMVMSQLQNPALDHFGGKELQLKQAFDKVAKYKLKYTGMVKSMNDLPKRAPNPMKGRPLVDRIIPGIGLQLQHKGNTMIDIYPNMRYRLTGRFITGLGWSQRGEWGFLGGPQEIKSVYGPKASLAYSWQHGFSLEIMPEYLNAFVLPYESPVQDLGLRKWVFGLPAGVRKDFVVYKHVHGFTQMFYNLYDSKHQSPYYEKLIVRFGFEFIPSRRLKVPASD
jgi:hypothetical protein